jgi:hypothetical protein
MRILHTIGRGGSGAATDALLALAQWQAAQGCHVVLATARSAPVAETARAAGLIIEPVEFEARCAGREALFLRAAARRHAIEVIHAHDEASSLQAVLCVDLCPLVRSLDKAEAVRLAEAGDGAPAFDHIVVDSAAGRDRLVKSEIAAPDHVTVLSGAAEARMARVLEAYERAIVRSLTGRLIPPRFTAGRPELRRLAPLAAE